MISTGRKQQQQMANDRQQNLRNEDNRDKGDDIIYQTMWLDIPCYTKYKFSLGHKTIYNCTISHLITLMMIG